jgi:hypothetical protein
MTIIEDNNLRLRGVDLKKQALKRLRESMKMGTSV